MAGLGPGDQRSEGDGPHTNGPHWPQRGLWSRGGIEAGPSCPEGKGAVSAGGEAVVDPEQAEVEASH